MSHAITKRSNGMSEMAYVGEKPWHGLGQELRASAPIEEWMIAAGMDWRVKRSIVRFAPGKDEVGRDDLKLWPDWHVLLRSDTREPLGMVSDRYKVVQPQEVLEFFRDLVDVAGFKLETAGTLHGGRKFWALASINAEDRIVGNDLVKGRLILATSCDGSMKTVAKNVTERVVCANTLAIAMGERGAPQVQISHRSKFDAEQVKQELGVAVDSFTRFIRDARNLAKRPVSQGEAQQFVAHLLGKAEAEIDEIRDDKGFQSIMSLFSGAGRGALLPGVRGTAWGLVNAVTEHFDHHVRARSQSNRLDSAWFGRGDDLKQKAMTMAVAMTN